MVVCASLLAQINLHLQIIFAHESLDIYDCTMLANENIIPL